MASYIWSTSLNTIVGSILKHLRIRNEMGQEDIAKLVNLPTSTISKLESGVSNITIEYLFVFCVNYNVSLAEFSKLIELCTSELESQKVYIYTDKAENVSVRGNTILATGVATAAAFAVLGPVFLAPSLIAAIGLTASNVYLKDKKDSTDKERDNSSSTQQKLELPKLSGKQVFSLLKDFFEDLDFDTIQERTAI